MQVLHNSCTDLYLFTNDRYYFKLSKSLSRSLRHRFKYNQSVIEQLFDYNWASIGPICSQNCTLLYCLTNFSNLSVAIWGYVDNAIQNLNFCTAAHLPASDLPSHWQIIIAAESLSLPRLTHHTTAARHPVTNQSFVSSHLWS